jgi:hypothetical protein
MWSHFIPCTMLVTRKNINFRLLGYVKVGRIRFNLELDSPKNIVLKTQNQGSFEI